MRWVGRELESQADVARVDVYGYDLTYVHGTYVVGRARCQPSEHGRAYHGGRRDEVSARRPRSGPPTCPLTGRGRARRCASSDRRCSGAMRSSRSSTSPRHGAAGTRTPSSALDVACWDLFGKATGQSVCVLLGGLRQASDLYTAVPLGCRRDGPTSRRGVPRDPPLPAEARCRSDDDAARVVPCSLRRATRRSDRRRERRLAAQDAVVAARLWKASTACSSTAVPDAGGVPLRAAADHPADGARRGDHRCARRPARFHAGGMEAMNLKFSKSAASARPADSRARRDARDQADDRGHLGR